MASAFSYSASVSIFREKPHLTWDNYFSGDDIMMHAGQRGFGLTMTCRQDCLPKDIPSHFVNKEKAGTDIRPRATHFMNPIFAIKKIPKTKFK